MQRSKSQRSLYIKGSRKKASGEKEQGIRGHELRRKE